MLILCYKCTHVHAAHLYTVHVFLTAYMHAVFLAISVTHACTHAYTKYTCISCACLHCCTCTYTDLCIYKKLTSRFLYSELVFFFWQDGTGYVYGTCMCMCSPAPKTSSCLLYMYMYTVYSHIGAASIVACHQRMSQLY